MAQYRGLTWDHPRGRVWLEAAAVLWRERGVDVVWESQPLEGFEAHPIADLCARYDLVVLDHPHLGDALAAGALQSLDTVFGSESPAFRTRSVGPSLESYQLEGRTWALPIDAATQVSARDPRFIGAAPRSWEDVERLAGEVPVALSLAGPHALLSLFSIAAALGRPPVDTPGEAWLDPSTARTAFDVLMSVNERAPRGYAGLNPIALLERVGSDDPLAYVPLVYGYVNYALPERAAPIAFGDAPRMTADGPPGSIIGGTGVAVSRGAVVTDSLREYLRWLVAESTQRRVVPEFAGQPAARVAWEDPETDLAAGSFYSATLATIEAARLRPRYAGFPDAQQTGSAMVRDVLDGHLEPADAIAQLEILARDSRAISPEGTL
ncbi:carbohydrate ABC transporter substrate-binding protein [Leucobacter chromiireducens]|uniref:carbohydrate ABC transporter substrate-binding protein n=1 Tax=Leucobacter chromiireducens TaxID=283877 RepID=UPI000F62C8C9|nr:carbohydrate ABC transporter substrate-binding protein [Leucobacter chromiireducens]